MGAVSARRDKREDVGCWYSHLLVKRDPHSSSRMAGLYLSFPTMISIELNAEQLALTVEALLEQANGVTKSIESLEAQIAAAGLANEGALTQQHNLKAELSAAKLLLSSTLDIAIKLKDASAEQPAG